MKHQSLLSLFAVAATACPSLLLAGQAELDFNEFLLGDTRVAGTGVSTNKDNFNTGSGFADLANGGEFDNNTGVLKFENPDIPVPAGVANYVSAQNPDVNGGNGVVISSSNGSNFPRMQERAFAAPILGPDIWFSFLTRIEGPTSEFQVKFNVPRTASASNTLAAFSIGVGHKDAPGAIGILSDLPASPRAELATLVTDPLDTSLIYYEDLNADYQIDAGEDTDGNGTLNGIDFSDGAGHLIIGRVQIDNDGTNDLIEVWIDPADALALGAPDLTLLSDELTATGGIFSVGFEGVRDAAASGDDGNGNYTDGGRADVDHFRISDAADAQDYVTGNALPDPSLDIAVDTPDANFVFGAVYGTTLPVTSTARTVKLINNGATQDIEIGSISFLDGNADGVFSITGAPATPFTLAAGASTTVTIEASSSDVTGQTFSETLVVDTDEDTPDNPQDRNISCSANFYPAGFQVNANGSMDSNLGGWENDDFLVPNDPVVRVTPGLNGTAGMARLKGFGDASGELDDTDNHSQIVPLGASNWEFTFLFSPADGLQFENLTGFPAFPGDRTFQLIIQADQQRPTAAAGTEGTWTNATNADASMINLTYQPDDDDFCVWDGSGGGWTPLGIGGLVGSIDGVPPGVITADTDGDLMDDAWEDFFFGDGIAPAEPAELEISDGTGDDDFDNVTDLDEFRNGTDPDFDDTDGDGITDDIDIPGDGRLDPANPNDTVNWYLVSIKGTGFGTGAASYTVSVSDPNTLNMAQASEPLTIFESADITANTPGAYTFTTGDVTSESGNEGICTSFWIDEVGYWSGQARTPAIAVAPGSVSMANHNGAGGTAEVTVTNSALTGTLEVSGITFGGGDFSIVSPPVPFEVLPGESQIVTVSYNGAGIAGDTMTINNNDVLTPAVEVALNGTATSNNNLLANWDFEVPGANNVSDADTFAVWNEALNATRITDVPGLTAGSTTACWIGGGALLRNNFGALATHFVMEYDFAIASATDRAMAFLIRQTGSPGQLNVRYQGNTNTLDAYNQSITNWSNLIDLSGNPLVRSVDVGGDGSLDDAGDTKVVYKLRITGNNWDGANSSIDAEIFDSGGVSQGSGSGAFFQASTPPAANQIELSSQYGGNPGWWADDVVIQAVVPANVTITGVSGGPGGFTINYDAGGADVNVRRSTNGISFSDIATGENSGSYTDDTAPAGTTLYQVYIP